MLPWQALAKFFFNPQNPSTAIDDVNDIEIFRHSNIKRVGVIICSKRESSKVPLRHGILLLELKSKNWSYPGGSKKCRLGLVLEAKLPRTWYSQLGRGWLQVCNTPFSLSLNNIFVGVGKFGKVRRFKTSWSSTCSCHLRMCVLI